MTFKKRVQITFDKYGESFLINGTTPAKGFFQQLDQARMSMYFDSVEQGWISRPALIAMVSAEVSVDTGDTITRDERLYTVEKMSNHRVRDEIVMQILLLI